MGITIHYEGAAKSRTHLKVVLDLVREKAVQNGWLVQEVEEEEGVLERVVDEEEADYVGHIQGVVVFPHEEAEPAEFLFGDDLFFQSYCKTQFAGAATHIALVKLLREISPNFERLGVVDEGEYWESGDADHLGSLILGCNEALSDLVRTNPNARIKVRFGRGRIIDALE